jgi:YD repeat-containing protein
LAIAIGGAVLIVGPPPWSRQPKSAPLGVAPQFEVAGPGVAPERITGYVGAAACRECHPGESPLYARSGHCRTIWPAESGRNPLIAWLDGQTWNDPEVPEVRWSYHVRDGRLVVERTVDGHAETLALDYGFGSGTHGVTFVALQPGAEPGLDPAGIEHRLSYFALGRRLGITPGQERSESSEERMGPQNVPFGKPNPPDRIQQCFGCHSTLTSTLASNRLELATWIPNVSCERCHGPGRAHIEAARRGETDLTMRMGQHRVEPAVEVGLCGSCHRLPSAIPSAKLRPDEPQNVRFHGVGISMSSCYADGLSGLRCVSCHDPHDRASTDRTAYEAVCLSCHQAGSKSKQEPCPVSPAADCLSCHMPRREIGGNNRFTDHWIRKPDPAAPPDGARPPTARLQ